MKYAYPQDPTLAASAIRRYDESSDSATSQSSLERQQDIAVVGETVPLIFCHRHDWGGKLGVNGGVWISPRLIQLGIRTTDLSMMYILSQGNVQGAKQANTYWGYQKLNSVDSSATMRTAYESVPSNLDLDYDPGGSLSWTTTQTAGGPSLSGSSGSFTSVDKVIKMVVTFNPTIRVQGSGQIIYGAGGTYTAYNTAVMPNWYPTGGFNLDGYVHSNYSGCAGAVVNASGSTVSCQPYPSTRCDRTFNLSSRHKSASWTQTSYVRYTYYVTNIATNQVVKSGYHYIYHGNSSPLTISGLPAAQYRLDFTSLYKLRNAPYSTHFINVGDNKPCSVDAAIRAIPNISGPSSGYRSHTNPGSETQNISSTVVQTIYNQIDFPELPGGDQQIVGGLSDLTMMGIRGNILKLRPQDGPEYFIQSHIFVEDGVQVERLTWGGTGSSPFYGDLVNYLMNKSKVLQADQIDKDSLILANRMNTAYKMYFNGVLQTTNSLAEWMTRTAPYFLLTPRQVDGKYGLWPVCPLNAANELSRDQTIPVMTVTADDIVEGSYGRSYISPRERRPVCLVMVYRDQPSSSVGQTVTVEVRYPGSALDGPFEAHDLTEHCCRPEQAIYAARYILAKRRYTTHTVSFTMARRGAQLKPGDIIKIDLALETTDGPGITDSIFYQLESLQEGQGGTVQIEATHFPTGDLDGATDVSVVAYEVHKGNVSVQ